MHQATLESNTLLRAIDPVNRARFLSRFQKLELTRGEVIHNQGQAVDRILFPLTGLMAVLSETLAGESVQTGMIGCEGAIGVVEVFGSGQFLSKGMVQIAGPAVRLSPAAYRELYDASGSFRSAAERYVEMQVTEARQLVACNALHTVESRLARAILDALDRSCLERELPLTQEALAQMLGAQRTTVAVCLSKLQRMGLVRGRRGALEIRDRPSLERTACSCLKTLQFARAEILASRTAAE